MGAVIFGNEVHFMEISNQMEDTALNDGNPDNTTLQKPPWSPALIATVTMLFSVLPGGIFHALNYERLGFPQRKISNLITNVLLFLFIFMASFGINSTLFFGLFQLIFHIGCATHFYKSQCSLYQKHLVKDGTKASIGYPVFTSIVIYLLILGVTFGLSFIDI